MSGALGLMMGSVAVNPIVQTGVGNVEFSQHDGTIDLAKPTSTAPGDLMVAFLARADDSDGWTLPSGWTSAADGLVGVAWKFAGFGSATYTFSVPDAVGIPSIRGVIASFSHCAVNAAGSIGTASGGAECIAPSVTLTDIGLLLGFFMNAQDLRTFTTPAGMLPVVANFDADAPSIAVFSQQLSSGASGTRSSTPSGGGDTAGVLIALKGVF